MFLSLIFLVTIMLFTLLELEAVCDDSCWSPPPCSLTSCNWPSGCCTVGCPSKTLIPESLVASSSSSCSYSYIIINNTYYSWTTWEFRLGTNGFSASKLHFTIKSYLFIWPCLWKNSKKYYDKFTSISLTVTKIILWQWIIVSLSICVTFFGKTYTNDISLSLEN